MGEGLKRAFTAAKATRFTLTPKRRDVLMALNSKQIRELDHHGIAVRCGKPYCAADWAHAPLRDLLEVGYVEVVGRKTMGGRLWRITDAGRAAPDA